MTHVYICIACAGRAHRCVYIDEEDDNPPQFCPRDGGQADWKDLHEL